MDLCKNQESEGGLDIFYIDKIKAMIKKDTFISQLIADCVFGDYI